MQTARMRWRSPHTPSHARLLVSVALGAVVILLSERADWASRALLGWNAMLIVLLAGNWRMMSRTTLSQLKRKAAQQDESAPVILGVMLTAVAASLGGVLAEIHNARRAEGGAAALYIALSLVTVVLSFVTMHVLFATHYAHRYYEDDDGTPQSRGLIFPEPKAQPNYFEFLYLSFCIGMTYQVSDVTTGNVAFRRLITLHGAVSFFYNTFVIALAVNLFSSLGG